METKKLIEQFVDPNFQGQLLENPHQALKKVGVDVPNTTQVKVVRNSKDCLHIAMPPSGTAPLTLSDDELSQIAAGDLLIASFVGFSFLVVAGVAGALLTIGVGAAYALGAVD